jgi:beta-lactamase class A
VELPLIDVMHLMIVLSDNTATNMILDRLGADAVNAYLDKIGIRTTRSLRKVGGGGVSAAGKLAENEKYGLGVSTPRDMVTMLERLEHGALVSAEASREMIAVMKRCTTIWESGAGCTASRSRTRRERSMRCARTSALSTRRKAG